MPKTQSPDGPSQRQLRVAEEVRHALSTIFARGEFRDPDLLGATITVTEVRASPDLKHMTAFVSGLGKDLPPKQFTALKKAGPWLRGQISKSVRLRHTPEIHFQTDTALDYAFTIAKALNQPVVARDLGKDEEKP